MRRRRLLFCTLRNVAGNQRRERESPLPEDWSEGAEPLREIIRELEKLFE